MASSRPRTAARTRSSISARSSARAHHPRPGSARHLRLETDRAARPARSTSRLPDPQSRPVLTGRGRGALPARAVRGLADSRTARPAKQPDEAFDARPASDNLHSPQNNLHLLRSQTDGLRRFAAPSSFSCRPGNRGAPRSAATEGRSKWLPEKLNSSMSRRVTVHRARGRRQGRVRPYQRARACRLSSLAQDQRVTYDLENDQRGKTAVNIQVD